MKWRYVGKTTHERLRQLLVLSKLGVVREFSQRRDAEGHEKLVGKCVDETTEITWIPFSFNQLAEKEVA
jgi:hypothetical protein